MKTNLQSIAIILLVSVFFTANAQTQVSGLEKLAPEIKTAFRKKYPSSFEESWTRVDKTILISFKTGNDYYDAFFDEKGVWLSTESSILYDQLPQPVRDSLKSGEFSNWEKGSVLKVELPGAEDNYKVYVYSKDWNEMEVRFDKTGKRIL
ncbi:MAG: PepSY-like domain-containing protein [Lentimicrobium sp.]